MAVVQAFKLGSVSTRVNVGHNCIVLFLLLPTHRSVILRLQTSDRLVVARIIKYLRS